MSRVPLMAADVGRDTLRSAADATWQPEMIYGHSRVPTATRCCTCYHQRSVAQRLWYCFQLCLFVTLSVCLSVNTITPEPLKISSQNFHGIILYGQKVRLRSRPSSKMAT